MAVLILVHEGLTLRQIPLDKSELVIGRKMDADIFIDDKMVSSAHAKIQAVADPDGGTGYVIEDLDSTNHTFVNGERITRHPLTHDDKIGIGQHVFKFIDEAAHQSEKTTKLKKSWIPGVYYTKE